MDPRISERRRQVGARRRRRWLTAALAVAVVVAFGVAGWNLLHSRVLAARVVTVAGSVHTPAAAVVQQAGLADHPPLLDVDPAAVAARLEALPWVAGATVTRQWPDTVHIAITERRPVAVVPGHQPNTFAEVDASGRVVALVASAPAGLVHLVVPAVAGPPGTTLGASAAPALQVAATLPAALAGQVVQVEDEPAGQVVLALSTPVTVALGTPVQLTAKYEAAAALLAGASLHDGDVIDVSVPTAPIVTGP
jgi:cell division protein FtsQ